MKYRVTLSDGTQTELMATNFKEAAIAANSIAATKHCKVGSIGPCPATVHVVPPTDLPVVVFEFHGVGDTPEQIANSAFNNIQQTTTPPCCTVVMPDGTIHSVDLEHVPA